LIPPGTILLGVWLAEGRAAITGSLTDMAGDTVPDVLAHTGDGWTTLVQALSDAAVMGAGSVLILTNSTTLVRALSPPFAPPAHDRTERVWWSKGDYTDVGVGGNAQHWRVLCELGGRWGGRFKVAQVDDLPKARELWQQGQ
jgi:hypothetical protein